jgi:type IV pilus assembly protein PilE
MRRHAGFTIIELMVAVAIVAVLAAIGYPSYTDYTRRGKIAEALSTLAEARAKLEQFYLDNRTYVGADATPLLPCGIDALNKGKKYFTTTCTALGGGTYTVTAQGNAAEGMGAFTYTIDQANTRASAVTGLSGWTGNTQCWVTRRGGVC